MKKIIGHGALIPRGYGVAWWSMTSMEGVCYPIPLNWVFRWARDFYYFLIQGKRDLELQEARKSGYRSGYDQGLQCGREEAYRRMFPNHSLAMIEAVLSRKEAKQ